MKFTKFAGYVLTSFLVGSTPLAAQAFQSASPDSGVQSFDTFDGVPVAIDFAGQVTGQNIIGAFVRDRDGTVTNFDVNGLPAFPQAMNEGGKIAGTGTCFDSTQTCGFIRKKNGNVIIFDPLPSGQYLLNLSVAAINTSGQVAGFISYFPQSEGIMHEFGFVRYVDGSISIFPDQQGGTFPLWEVTAMNSAGTIVGFLDDGGGYIAPFLRSPDGTVTTFTTSDGLVPGRFTAISPCGEITGYLRSGDYAFVRDVNGALTTFSVPDSILTQPVAITPSGKIVGSYVDVNGAEHGFLRMRTGKIQTFDVPDSTNTYPTSVNAEGDIAGWYSDSSGNVRGFIRWH